MQRIATLTMNPSLDASAEAERVVADRKVRTSEPVYDAGGGGVNVARVAARLGADPVAVVPLGGATGERLSGLLHDEGIEVHAVDIQGETRTNLTVSETSTDQQYRFVGPGPTLTEDEWRNCLDAVADTDADWIVASGSLPPGVPDELLALLAKRIDRPRERLIIDSSGAALRAAAEEGVFLVKPNVAEIQDLVGRELGSTEMEAAARELVDGGAASVVLLSLGAGGAYLAAKDVGERLHPPTVPIVSRVGAGDSMVAGVVTALARGEGVPEAARLGLAAGSAAVSTAGTRLAERADVERLRDSINGPS